MATTTATISLSSTDILSQAISLSETTTLYKHNTTATGLEQINYHRCVLPTGENYDLIEESAALADKANYVYIINKNTPVDDYVEISINAEVIGNLYGGDWMFIPWSCDISAAANDSTIEARAYTNSCTVEFALFHSGETLVAATDS
tara:strand:+ start:108 stop:548 length:441 start_codon:yes stop_codon:yes gene_type:complete